MNSEGIDVIKQRCEDVLQHMCKRHAEDSRAFVTHSDLQIPLDDAELSPEGERRREYYALLRSVREELLKNYELKCVTRRTTDRREGGYQFLDPSDQALSTELWLERKLRLVEEIHSDISLLLGRSNQDPKLHISSLAKVWWLTFSLKLETSLVGHRKNLCLAHASMSGR